MFPHKAEKKLSDIFTFYTRKRIRRSRKASKAQLALFELTPEEKKQIIEDLTKVAIRVNVEMFDSWRTLSKEELVRSDLTGAKAWIKRNYELLNDDDYLIDNLKRLREKRLEEMLKTGNFKYKKMGLDSKDGIRRLKQELKGQKVGKDIRRILEDIEHGKFSKGDFDRLNDWMLNRNKLIARNETGNLYAGELRELMETNEIEFFVWKTMEDNRVRYSHAARNDKVYDVRRVDLLPGQDFNCRCWAEPVAKKKNKKSK